MVRKPRSEESRKGAGLASRCEAIVVALEGDPTVIWARWVSGDLGLWMGAYQPIGDFPGTQT